MSGLEARGIVIRRDGRTLIHAVSFSAPIGTVLAIVGPNGAGKTTLLDAVAGKATVDGGTVVFDKQSMLGAPAATLARRRAAMAQHFDCPFGYSVREVIGFARLAHAGTASARRDHSAIAAALSAADLVSLAGRSLPTLSGGERQRVAFAKALAQLFDCAIERRPHLLLLDEPTASLDPEHQHRMLREARAAAARGAAVVVTMHDLSLTSIYADRVLMLDRGRVIAHGPTQATLTPDLVRTVFRIDVGLSPVQDGPPVMHALPQ